MHKKKNREISTYSASFLDVLSNTIGGLAFLLILAIIMIGSLIYAPPVIMTEQLIEAYHDTDYKVWLGAKEGMGKFEWRLGSGSLPEGLTLDGKTGKLSGKPMLPENATSPTKYKFEIICETLAETEEKTPRMDSKIYELKIFHKLPGIIQPLKITTTSPLPEAFLNQPYPLTLAAEGGLPPYRWESIDQIPPGLSISDHGKIEGQPKAPGTFPITVRLTSSKGETTQKNFNLKVVVKHRKPDPIPPLQILTTHLPDSLARKKYTLFLAAQGGVPPYQWKIEKGKLSWASINTGKIEGTPDLEDISENKIVLSLLDSKGKKVSSGSLSLNVLPPPGKKPPPLKLKTAAMPDSILGHNYEVALSVSGGYPPYEWTTNGDLDKTGITFNASEGIFSGTPNKFGTFKASAVVRDRFGKESSKDYSVKIVPNAPDLKIKTKAVPAGRAQEKYTIAFSASGGYPPYSWSIKSGKVPKGLKLNTNGMLAGIPKTAGDWAFKIQVSDSAGRKLLSPSYKMRVYTAEGHQKFEILTKSLPTFLTGHKENFTLACQGGAPPYSMQELSDLPDGFQIEGARLLGKPVKTGEFKLKLKVEDTSGQSEEVTYTLTVRRVMDAWIGFLLAFLLALCLIVTIILFYLWKRHAQNTKSLEIKTKSIPNGRASMEYGVYLACEGGVGPYKWTLQEGELPPGLELSEDGCIFGTPLEGVSVDDTKEYGFTVQVTDSVGNKSCQYL